MHRAVIALLAHYSDTIYFFSIIVKGYSIFCLLALEIVKPISLVKDIVACTQCKEISSDEDNLFNSLC